VIGRITGAVLRGLLVALLIATPSLILPRVDPDGAQVIALVAIFAALLTAFEYGSNYPCLFEFRDAPPFNRIRFLSLMMTVVLLSLIARGQYEPNSLSSFLALAGHLVAGSLDFPYSPVRLVILMLPEGTDDASLFRWNDLVCGAVNQQPPTRHQPVEEPTYQVRRDASSREVTTALYQWVAGDVG